MGGFHIEPKMMGSESGISNRKGSVGGYSSLFRGFDHQRNFTAADPK
jgi:hypothetical protein